MILAADKGIGILSQSELKADSEVVEVSISL